MANNIDLAPDDTRISRKMKRICMSICNDICERGDNERCKSCANHLVRDVSYKQFCDDVEAQAIKMMAQSQIVTSAPDIETPFHPSQVDNDHELEILMERKASTEHKFTRVLTFGSFDMLHYGHTRLLRRARALGDHLTVALSTDEFTTAPKPVGKGKRPSYYTYDVRKEMLESIRYVDMVVPEETWDTRYELVNAAAWDEYYSLLAEGKPCKEPYRPFDICVMGSDWYGDEMFEKLRPYCDVVYLERTHDISTTQIKDDLGTGSPNSKMFGENPRIIRH